MTLPTSATLPQRVVGTTTVLLRAIMKYRRQELDNSAAVASDSSAGLSHADDHLELCAALHYRNTTDGAYSEPDTFGDASITVRMPRRSANSSI
jgi:hypothetical protein